jgi:hypothetical protein
MNSICNEEVCELMRVFVKKDKDENNIKIKKRTPITFRFEMLTTRTRDCFAKTSAVELQSRVSIITLTIIIVLDITIVNATIVVVVVVVVRIH